MLVPFARLTAHLALVTALSVSPVSPAAERVLSIVAAGTPRSSERLGGAVKELLSDAPTPKPIVDFGNVQGTWRVVHAPHIDTLSSIALTTFDPIEYRISADGGIASYVRYNSKIFGAGWLCTDGTIANVAEAARPEVRIVWDRVWWQIGGAPDAPPTDPDAEGAAALRDVVQAVGKAGFIEPLSVFPVRYVDEELGIFNFQAFTVTARRASTA